MFNLSSDPATDLAANRNGVLDPAQKNRLLASLLPTLAMWAFAGLVGGVLVFFILPFLAFELRTEAPWLWLVFAAIPLVALLALAFTGVLGRQWAILQAIIELMSGEPKVQFADGDLTWRGRGYAARGEGFPLALPPQADWLPGNYRFYLLPRSRLIINAERVPGEVDTIAEVNRALQGTLGFTAEDVQANHHQRLGVRQRLTLLGHAAPIGLVMVFFLAVNGFVFQSFAQEFAGEDIFVVFIVLTFAGIFGVVLLLTLLPLLRDVLSGQVVVWEGPTVKRAITTGSGRNRRTNYYYEVNGQRARVTHAAYEALISGQRYRVFVAPISQRVVAAEWLG